MRGRLALSLLVALAAIALAAAVRRETSLAVAGEAVAIVGIFALPLAYRLYRRSADVRLATLTAASITLGASLLGALAIALGGAWSALSGALAHVALVGAIWPTEERVANFTPEEEG